MAVYAGTEISERGLVLHLDAFNPKSYPGSGTTWFDLSGRGNNAVLINGPVFDNINGGTISFDGTNDYAQVSSHTLSTPITISAFVRLTDLAKTMNTLINTIPHNVIAMSLNRSGAGQLEVYIGNGSGWLAVPSISASVQMGINKWYHVVFTSTGSGSTLYIDGKNVGTSVHSPSGWGSSYYIGTIGFASGEYFKGNIAQVSIYNRVISEAEIRLISNAFNKRYYPVSLPRTYYPSDILRDGLLVYLDGKDPASYSGSGTTWNDLSGNGVNGTIVGSPTFTDGYFDITSDSTYITMPNATMSHRTGDFTYHMWINFDATDTNDTVFSNGAYPDTLMFGSDGSSFIVNAENAQRGSLAWTAATGVWRNIVLRRIDNIVSMFINGVQSGTPFTMTLDINIADTQLWLMRAKHTTNQFVNGKISAFAVYNRGLSNDDIVQNFNMTRRKYNV